MKISSFSFHDQMILWTTVLYLAVVSGFMIWHRVFFSPDRFFVFAFVAMVALGRAWLFFWDWIPPLFLIFGYEYLRGLVPQLIAKVHIHFMIFFDRALFGVVPTVAFQHWFYSVGRLHWYDYAAVAVYLIHFIMPMLIAMIFWFTDRQHFKRYMSAMVLLSYMAFLTYYMFPAMPPWMAAQQGFLDPVAKIIDQVMAHFGRPTDLPTVYQYFGANLIAAVPSLHAAYPLLTGLYLRQKFPRVSIVFFFYVVGVWLAVVYLGEHYVFDVFAGIVYAVIVYTVMNDVGKVRSRLLAALRQIFKRKNILINQ